MSTNSEKKRKPDGPTGSYGKGASKRMKHCMEPGDRGVLLSSISPNRTKESIREFLDIVAEFGATIGKTKTDDEVSDEQDEETRESSAIDVLERSLTSELAELSDKSRRFVPIREIARCVSFVKFHHENDIPSHLVTSILNAAASGKHFPCKSLSRIVPLDTICKPFLAHFEKAAAALVALTLPESAAATNAKTAEEQQQPDGEEKEIDKSSPSQQQNSDDSETRESEVAEPSGPAGTWSCRFNSRSMCTLKKSDVLDVLTKLVGPRYKVDITKADFTIIVEVAAPFCGISIVKDYCNLANLNIFTLVHGHSATQQKGGDGGKNAKVESCLDSPSQQKDKDNNKKKGKAGSDSSSCSATQQDVESSGEKKRKGLDDDLDLGAQQKSADNVQIGN